MQRFVSVMVFWLALCGVSEAADSGSEGVGAKERIIMGWVERVVLIPWGVELKAKLDSGAKTSSLHAEDIERFEKDGEEWVRFIIELEGKGEEIEPLQVEQPLVRNVRIKRHRGNAKRRPVVNLKFCLNGKGYETQFSLVDRSRLNYPVLFGRRFLKDVALIDPSKTFLTNEGWNTCLIKYAADEASDKKAETQQD
ncbi:protein of unknown function DUF785 [Nitrosococcus halophilus Nc 4]|uniref:Retropepsin-like aspartic endopeptidase domain-containing protein n=1 Tax=Nitrosococcus halophilus (strain Nc4) TaxID=472759 RepID=D5C4H7_NITHN|nr:ATP-dependent zinc protease [Nitrosococcus halophilus]ADE15161.1 protein of unknown function DUF785 [Nitrosococcus halophilus Nc 4]